MTTPPIHAQIRAARESLGIHPAEAARRCGLLRQNYGPIESGKTTPTLATLEKICKGLGLEMEIVLKRKT